MCTEAGGRFARVRGRAGAADVVDAACAPESGAGAARRTYIYWENVYLHEILKKKPRFRVFLNVSRMFHGNFSSHRKNVRKLKVEISTIPGRSFFFLFFGHE